MQLAVYLFIVTHMFWLSSVSTVVSVGICTLFSIDPPLLMPSVEWCRSQLYHEFIVNGASMHPLATCIWCKVE